MYGMLCTRPDIAFAVQQISQFSSNPSTTHLQVAKRILRYLKGTISNGITYRRSSGSQDPIVGYCDSDFANGEDRKSIAGDVFLLAGGAIGWKSKKQPTVALSTCEAEHGAVTTAAKEFLWLCQLTKDLGCPQYAPTIQYSDNQDAIAVAKNPESHARTKHIDVKLHFIRQHVEEGRIDLRYCPTDEMVADILTKALPREKHLKFGRSMGMDLSEKHGSRCTTQGSRFEEVEQDSTGDN
jgi:hypothetical protein